LVKAVNSKGGFYFKYLPFCRLYLRSDKKYSGYMLCDIFEAFYILTFFKSSFFLAKKWLKKWLYPFISPLSIFPFWPVTVYWQNGKNIHRYIIGKISTQGPTLRITTAQKLALFAFNKIIVNTTSTSEIMSRHLICWSIWNGIVLIKIKKLFSI
jgi:hypothetical protein